MSENTLLLSEDKTNLKSIFSDVSIFRRFESVSVVSLMNIKRALNQNIRLVIINAEEYFPNEIIKTIEIIKRASADTHVIVILSKNDENFIQKCINCGTDNFIHSEISKAELNLHLSNSLKMISLKDKFKILSIFLNNTSSVNSKTGLFTHKALKESYYYLKEYHLFNTAAYVVLTIDSEVKTKVSMNRLGQSLKKTLRQTDVIAQGAGKYYLLLPQTTLGGAVTAVEKIADIMGHDIKLRAGIAISVVNDFDVLEKNANDSLKSAVANEELCVCLEHVNIDENLSDTFQKDKHFKLFQKVFDKKLKDLIEPFFFRAEKEFQAKLDDVLISQYANKVECVFGIKNNKRHSELIIHYDGFAKFNLKIIHNGLDTCENTSVQIPLNKLDDKILKKYITQLYSEFNQD